MMRGFNMLKPIIRNMQLKCVVPVAIIPLCLSGCGSLGEVLGSPITLSLLVVDAAVQFGTLGMVNTEMHRTANQFFKTGDLKSYASTNGPNWKQAAAVVGTTARVVEDKNTANAVNRAEQQRNYAKAAEIREAQDKRKMAAKEASATAREAALRACKDSADNDDEKHLTLKATFSFVSGAMKGKIFSAMQEYDGDTIPYVQNAAKNNFKSTVRCSQEGSGEFLCMIDIFSKTCGVDKRWEASIAGNYSISFMKEVPSY